MKVSEITVETVKQYARIDEDDGSDISPSFLISSAKAYASGYTGLSEQEMDQYEDITIAILVLCSDMFDNRQMTIERSNVNNAVQTILDMHCVNLV